MMIFQGALEYFMSRNRNLPPLGPLRGFEAAARCGSFTKAARELHLTQTAISHQIRSLEAHLGQQLFDRSGQKLKLSDDGRRLQQLCTGFFDQLDTLCHEISSGSADLKPLRIALAPAFASRWLTARLPDFWAAHKIQLDLIPSAKNADFQLENIDLGIRCGNGNWPGLTAEWLMPVRETPLCASHLLSRAPLEQASDIQHHTLLHEHNHNAWREWCNAQGLDHIDCSTGIICQDSIMLYDLILAGQGIGLGSALLVEKELKQGSLVAPFHSKISPEIGYYLLYRDGALRNPAVATFRQFVLQAVAEDSCL